MKRILAVLAVTCIFLASSPALAREWKVDPNHSQAVFTIKHIVGKVTGFFNEFSLPDKKMKSKVVFDSSEPKKAEIQIVINTWSLDSGITRRDKHLATSDFFDSRNYPVITFKSTDVRKTGKNTFTARGKLTIKDVTKTVTVPFTFLEPVKHPDPKMKTSKAAFEGKISVNRLDYNVGTGKFFKMGLVGDMVDMVIYLEMFEK